MGTVFVILIILLKAKFTQTKPFGLVRERWREIMRKAYEVVGRYWVENYLPEHFKAGAQSKYHYKSRTAKYLLQKNQGAVYTMMRNGVALQRAERVKVAAGADTPLVLTGYMRDQVLKNNVVRGFPTRATVILYGPAYMDINFKSASNQPDKPAEMTRLTAEETKVLSKLLRDEVVKGINAVQGTKVSGEAA